jgi:hypothetical protein
MTNATPPNPSQDSNPTRGLEAVSEERVLRVRDSFSVNGYVNGNIAGREIRAICDAYLALRQRERWQPIATAPQSGKKILLCWPKHKIVASGRYDIDEEFDYRPNYWVSPSEGWRNDGDQCIPRNQEDCTLWQPLPPLPSTGSTGGGT